MRQNSKQENKFKTDLCNRIEKEFPGSMVMHLDPTEKKGIPDLLVLHNDKWAVLEGKRSKDASRRLHQDYYVKTMNDMSYASFIYPENEEQVIQELHEHFNKRRTKK